MQLQIQNLSKIYPNGVKALDNVSITIQKGMFGLLGPNGAGKSSLMRTIATLQMPDSGSVYFDELDVLRDKLELRKMLGYLPQSFGVYPRTKADNLLDYLAQLKGISSKQERKRVIDYVLEVTNLTDVKRKNVSSFSGGMKQRFGIAQMLLNDPKLIIVDEPTAGLDPEERQRFLNILRQISRKSIVIFSTHIVEDISELCTDMAILNKGKLVAQILPEDAIQEMQGHIFSKNIQPELLEQYQLTHQVLSTSYNRDNSLKIKIYAEGQIDNGFVEAKPSLEDYYFSKLKEEVAVGFSRPA